MSFQGLMYHYILFDNTTKTISCKPVVEQSGYTMPNSILPRPLNTYTLVDISMPQSYIDAAELELKTKTLNGLQKTILPKYFIAWS